MSKQLLEDGVPYQVDWLDSGMQMDLGWKLPIEHMQNWDIGDLVVTSTGLAVYEDEDVIGLGLSRTVEGQIFGLQIIVKNNIKEIRELK